MRNLRYKLLLLFSVVLLAGRAQGEIEIDWSAYAQDTVAPVFVHSIDLGYDCAGDYSVEIEYPELQPLTAEETMRFRLSCGGELPEWPEVEVYKGISAKRGQLDIRFTPIVWRDGKYWGMRSFTLKVLRAALAQKTRVVGEEERYAAHSVLSTGRWVKVRVANNGIHMLMHSHLKQMGFDDPDKVRLFGYGGLLLSENDIDSWRDDLCEVPLWRESDRVLFYANASVGWKMASNNTFSHTRNPYSDYGYYFLTEDAVGSPADFPVEEGVASQQNEVVKTTPAYVLYEADDYAWIQGGRNLVENYDYANGRARLYSLSVPGACSSSEAALKVRFSHNAYEMTSLSVAVEDSTAGTLWLSGIEANSEASFATSDFKVLLNDANSELDVVLVHERSAGVSGHLDYLCLSYMREIGLNCPIYAAASGVKTYEVASTDKDVVVWRVTDASAPACIHSELMDGKLYFSTKGVKGDVYIAFNPHSEYPVPEKVGDVVNQDLHATEAVDYVIIVPANGQFVNQAERLAEAHRVRRGLSVKVVRADEIYNEFSSGTPDATAYRRYLKMLYDRAETIEEAPKYLLLFGDGAWDNRMLTSSWKGLSPDDYLLCYEAENSYSVTSSHVVEDYFGFLDDGEGANLKRDKVDVGVGRFPVTMVSQASEVVDKIIAYMDNAEAGGWRNTILMLGDDGDNNRHMIDAEAVAQMLETEYPDYMVKRVYWDSYPMVKNATGNSYPAVRKRLLELFKEGALMVNYTGHGAPDVLSHELVINRADMSQLRSLRLPVWVTASCDITPFDHSVVSFGEAAFLNPYGGAIGLFTSTRTTFAEQNKRISHYLSKYILARDEDYRRLSLGDALRMAKCSLVETSDQSLRDVSGNKLNYVLIGDPALIVGNAGYRMVVDELNGTPVADGEELLLKAGSKVVVKGHVDVLDGSLATDFSGTLYASVFDNIKEVKCRNNANVKDLTPFVYHERKKKLFVGSDSVKNGAFSFTFRVPMDINYSNESGLINLYAVDSAHTCEAMGAFDDFLLGGTADDLENQGVGPDIQLFLNSTSFVSGDKVNETPRLMAILEDEDGINTAGNLGHNLVAIVDGKSSMTYTLNEYYVSEAGGYTRGAVTYMLPELSEGKHTLMLRAWDMMNNPSTATIEFEVVKNLPANILHVQACPDLLQKNTTFVLDHDRPENDMMVTIEVFDPSGRIVWNHCEEVVSPNNTYSYTWDYCGASGQPLDEGVYLYRVLISSSSGTSTSKAQKMVIMR